MFRLLGLLCSMSVEAHQAAALADVGLDRAERLLEDLVDVHLLEQPAAGRYRLHYLLRRFACAKACETLSEPPGERRANERSSATPRSPASPPDTSTPDEAAAPRGSDPAGRGQGKRGFRQTRLNRTLRTP
jgi:hypothetical protein